MGRRWVVLGLPSAVAAGVVAGLAGPAALMLAVGGVAAVALPVLSPGIVLALYLLIPFYKGALQPLLPVDVTLVLALLNAVQVVRLLGVRPRRGVSRAGIGLWLGVGALALAGTLYAPDQGLAAAQAAGFWVLVVLPILPAALVVGADARELRRFLWSLVVAATVIVVLGFELLSSTQRLTVGGMNTIQVSRAVLLLPLLGTTFVLSEAKAALRLATLALMPVAILVALASGSRGPLLVLALMAAMAVARLFVRAPALAGRRLVILGSVVAATAVIVTIIPALLPALALDRFTLFFDFVGTTLSGDTAISSADTSSGARVRLFGLAMAMFEDRPLLGAGTAGFEALSPVYVGPVGGDAYPHNALLQFAAEFGLVGVATFLGVVVAALLRPLPPGLLVASLRALAVFFLLNAMISGNILQDRMLWALLVLLLVVDPRQLQAGAHGRAGPPDAEHAG